MFAETARLIITVESKDVDEAKRRLDGLGKVSQATEKATGSLTAAFGKLFAVYAAAKGAIQATASFRNVIRDYESLRGQLKTATGSAEDAKEAFEALQEFAMKTPFGLKQATEAFVQLTNLGLTPSERALYSYGNTAAAMGREMTEMANAVAQATNGNFMSLRSFGILAQKENDGIVFSFQGTREKVANTTKAIEEYFIRLGETKFGTAMADQMNTLRGALANFEDAWEQMFDRIGMMGVSSFITKAVKDATVAVEEFTNMLASGEIEAYLNVLILKFGQLGSAGKDAFNDIRSVFTTDFTFLGDFGSKAVNWIIDAFKLLPENVAVLIRAIGATFRKLGEYAKAGGTLVVDMFSAAWTALVTSTKNSMELVGKLISNPLNVKSTLQDFLSKQTKAVTDFGTEAFAGFDKAVKGIVAADLRWQQSIIRAMDLRDQSIAQQKKEIDSVKDLREAYRAMLVDAELTRFFSGVDRLAKYKKGPDDAAPNVSEAQRGQFEALRDSLGLQEEAIARSYEKRKELIIQNTHDDTALQVRLLKELDAAVRQEMAQAAADRYNNVLKLQQDTFEAQAQGRAVEAENLRMQLEHELQMIQDGNELRKQVILADATLTAEEKTRRILEIERRSQAQQLALDRATQSARLNLAADFFGNLSTISQAFGKRGAKIAQAAAIVQTTIKTYESATSAYASLAGIPYVGPALGAAAAAAAIAAGMANVAAIRSQSYQGAYAYGGNISPGKYGLVGETGTPEFVKGPAIVQSARTTENLLNKPQKGGNVHINVINNAGVEVETRESETMDGRVIEMIISKAVDRVTNEIDTGGNKLSSTMQSRFGLRRASTFNAA